MNILTDRSISMDKVAFIYNVPYETEEGETNLDFVRRNIRKEVVPTLCHADNLQNYGSCRIYSVEVALSKEGPSKVIASCLTLAIGGQFIFPSTEKLKRLRKNNWRACPDGLSPRKNFP